MVIMSLKLTAFTQNFSRDSVKCFSYEQARQIAKAIKKGEICDSISQIQGLQILNFKQIVDNNNRQIEIKDSQILTKNQELNTANLKLKVSKNLTKFGIPTALLGGFFVGFLLK